MIVEFLPSVSTQGMVPKDHTSLRNCVCDQVIERHEQGLAVSELTTSIRALMPLCFAKMGSQGYT